MARVMAAFRDLSGGTFGRITMAARARPTLVDRSFQLAYVCAYKVMRSYWTVRHPTTHGALVMLWNAGQVLLVRNSYVPFYGLPGGYLRNGETARDAAVRELLEEVGLELAPERLQPVLEETHDWEGKRDHVQIFSVDLVERPRIAIDHREVVDASWWNPEGALALTLFPPLRRALQRRTPRGE